MDGQSKSSGPIGRALTPCGRTRREFMWEAGGGFVGTALAALLAGDGFLPRSAAGAEPGPASDSPLAPKAPHFAAKAKACIVLFMYGGVSQVDTFDPKPELSRYHGKPIPTLDSDQVLKGRNPGLLLGSTRSLPGTVRRGSRSPIFIRISRGVWMTWRSSGACMPIALCMAPGCSR